MKKRSISFALFFELILFAIILIFAIRPVENYDFWFHVKYGEYIFKTHSLPFIDVFSHTAYGTPAIPYEWLFQLLIYIIYSIFGAIGVQTVVVLCTLTYTYIFRRILVEIFHVPLLPRSILTLGVFIIGYDFWVERPQSVAFLIFMTVLYLVLKKVFLNSRKALFFTPPLFFIWANLHASMILGLYLFFSFSGVLFIIFMLTRDKEYLKKASDLCVFGIINTLITILPPLGIKSYQLLYLFFQKRSFITNVIGEWVPLPELGIRYYIYLAIMIAAGLALVFALWKSKEKKKLLLFIPFIPLGLFVISGVRQTIFSMPVIFLLFIPAIQYIKIKISKLLIYTTIALWLLASIVILYFYREAATGINRSYPYQAIPFIKSHIKGNMFNELEMGGFLMYQLGPEYKTFIDGRTDMFLPFVFPEAMKLIFYYHKDDPELLTYFTKLANKYNISWAIITTKRYNLTANLARVLLNNSRWHLVFFDDQSEIFVVDNGQNTKTINEFSVNSATPFSKTIYKKGQKEQAQNEYKRMFSIAKSAVSANALGFMLLEDGDFDQAKSYFEQALLIDSKAAAPKMNLAELAAKDGDFTRAIDLYKQAIDNEPNRGLAYLRLGQLIVQSGGDKTEAIEIWKKGLTVTPDEEIIKKLKKELEQ